MLSGARIREMIIALDGDIDDYTFVNSKNPHIQFLKGEKEALEWVLEK